MPPLPTLSIGMSARDGTLSINLFRLVLLAERTLITSSVTNNITVSGGDAQATAAMVGVHLDRTANDISRNLQGAFQ